MDLILWRHADAEAGGFDLARELTPRGRDQAARMAAWLRRHLPAERVVLASPAVRAQQTAQALGEPIRIEPSLAPGASTAAITGAARQGRTVVLVGHQPDLGMAIAQLLCGAPHDWPLDKGALCWIRDQGLRALVSPDLL